MLINMYDSRWYELTFGIHLFKHICLIMRMSFVSYRTEFKNIFLNVVMASPELYILLHLNVRVYRALYSHCGISLTCLRRSGERIHHFT